MEQIPLAEAIICINCNTLARGPVARCPHCAGECLVPLANWLGPKPARRAYRGNEVSSEVARVMQTARGAEQRLNEHARIIRLDRAKVLSFMKRLVKSRRTVPA